MNFAKALEKADVKRIPSYLKAYEDEYDSKEYKKHIKLEGKLLGVANREQAAWYVYYDERKIEIKSVLNFLEKEILRVRSKQLKTLTEGYQVDLNLTEKERYINSDEKYLELKALALEVEELYEKYSSIVRGFEQRGYQLRNLTEMRVAALDDVEI